MPRITPRRSLKRRAGRLASFTIVELLLVMLIISILVGLLIMAGSGALEKAKRARAIGEIKAMTSALEAYKVDNGIYPFTNSALSYQMSGTLLTNPSPNFPYLYSTKDGSSAEYIANSQVLYLGLSGQTNFSDVPASGASANRAYMSFNISQIASPTANSYVKDSWNYAYGYSIGTPAGAGTPQYPINGLGFFDLWSTGGVTVAKVTATPSLTNAWISNW